MNKIFAKLRHYYTALGLRGVVAFLTAKLMGSTPLFAAKLPGIKHPIFLRLATTDVSVFKQVLIEKQYDYALDSAPRVILDAGANIGLSAVYFANRFPDAVIIALEPEPSNFDMLVKNTAAYPKVQPVNAALWATDANLALVDPGAGSHGFQTHQRAEGDTGAGVKGYTVNTLMNQRKLTEIDLLKIDIEGAEREIFRHSGSWINQVRVIMAELHDHLAPGCTATFDAATANFRTQGSRGETVIKINRTETGVRPDARASARM